jgi:hypothetical protein
MAYGVSNKEMARSTADAPNVRGHRLTARRYIILAAVLVLMTVVLAGCSKAPEGNSTAAKPSASADSGARDTAVAFLECVARGDVHKAQTMTDVPLAAPDLEEVRLGLFGSKEPTAVSGFSVDEGVPPFESNRLVWMALRSYTNSGGDKVTLDALTTEKYQIGLFRRGSGWAVEFWSTSGG